MTDVCKLADDLFQRGRYAEALKAARQVRTATKADIEAIDCLICECLQYGGELEESYALASVAIEKRPNNALLAARYYSVIGRVRLDQNRREEASQAFSNGIRAAERSGDLMTLARAQQLRLVSAGNADPTLTSSVRNAYRTAVRTGNPTALAGFHVRLAQLEGQRGSFAPALHHVSLAQSLLGRSEHLALLATLHVNQACVLGLSGAFAAARKSAETAARLAEEAGCARLLMAASIGVANSALGSGDLSVAESWLKRSLAIMNRLNIVEGNLLENLASIELIKGQPDNAAKYLAQALHPVEDPKWTAGGEGYTLLTELYLHKKRRNTEECRRVLTALKTLGTSQGDRHLQVLTALAEAEFEFDQFRHEEGQRLLAECLTKFSPDVIYWSELSRIGARTLWVQGHVESAQRRLARACALSDVRGTRLVWADGVQEQIAAGDVDGVAQVAYSIEQHARQAQTKFAALTADGNQTWFDLVPSKKPSARRDPLDGFDDAASLLELAGEPELRGREALASILALNISDAVALIERGSSGIRLIAGHRWARQDLPVALKAAGTVRLEVGAKQSHLIELILQPKKDLRSLFALTGIRRLLDAARALESQQKDQQRLGALWQPEIIIEEPGAVFSSPQMIELMQTARKVAVTSLPVLLMGDTGTGKEVLARAIHRASPRANEIFLPFNCSAVPRDMVESQLFGYRRGSFTGAHADFLGIIRSAEGGTLFLDEIGELSMDLQPKLLRFLETNEVHPLGEGKPIKVDVRVIAATNADLDQLIERKEFREDLYYRLNIVRFHMPQLSERREEIPPLVMHLLRRFEMDEKKHSIKISDELMEYLLLYRWPGNVRQLSNELRKMVAMSASNETLSPEYLSPAIRRTRRTVAVDPDAEPTPPPEPEPADPGTLAVKLDQPLPEAVEALERAMIERAIARTEGRIEEAARLLGISRKGLFLKRRRWHSSGGDTPPAT